MADKIRSFVQNSTESDYYKSGSTQTIISAPELCEVLWFSVWFIGSVPESHKGNDMYRWGQGKVKKILSKHAKLGTTSMYSTVFQCSSIGSLGQSPDAWLTSGLGWSFNGGETMRDKQIKVMFPSYNNVINGHDGLLSGGCLPYTKDGHSKQLWLREYLHQWKSDPRHRSQALPHLKSYSCISHDNERMTWFILTSANLSKAAWGMYSKNRTSLFIQSYEVGVAFLPRTILNQDTFDISTSGKAERVKFPVPYSLPVVRYDDTDKPWFMDYIRMKN